MLDASFWMLDWAASFDLCRLTSTLGVGRSSFAPLERGYGETSERLLAKAFGVGRFPLLSDVTL